MQLQPALPIREQLKEAESSASVVFLALKATVRLTTIHHYQLWYTFCRNDVTSGRWDSHVCWDMICQIIQLKMLQKAPAMPICPIQVLKLAELRSSRQKPQLLVLGHLSIKTAVLYIHFILPACKRSYCISVIKCNILKWKWMGIDSFGACLKWLLLELQFSFVCFGLVFALLMWEK